MNPLLFVGFKFGRLTILRVIKGKGRARCICKCSCVEGIEIECTFNDLKMGNTKSCGCLKVEKLKEARSNEKGVNNRNFRHGKSTDNYLYRLWHGIKDRCYNDRSPRWKYYGKLGVTMYEPWKDNYLQFEDWIVNNLGHKSFESLSLDRFLNSKGNYEPNNLRWATKSEQRCNQR